MNIDYRKCPNCGAQIKPSVSTCEFCGTTSGLEEFLQKYQSADGRFEQSQLVDSLAIPNTKSEILELFFLASSNVVQPKMLFDAGIKGLEGAWRAKFEQIYMKAVIVLKDEPEMAHVEQIYREKKKAMKWKLF